MPARRFTASVFFLAIALAADALASGFYFGENGSKALLQGGAFTAEADDLTAVQHNPGGLSQLSGFSFLIDSELLQHDVAFLRKDPGVDRTLANQVSNTGGFFYLPNAAIGYGLDLLGRPLTVALGVYGPPAVGRYKYPTPDYSQNAAGDFVQTPKKFAPQRYALINNDVIILYPSLAASLEVHPRVSVGGSFQYVLSSFQFTQAVYSGLYTPPSQRDEDPGFDSLVTVDLNGTGGYTGVFGVLARATDSLSFGASLRPPVKIVARGDFTIAPGPFARQAGTEVSCPGSQIAGTDTDGDGQLQVREISQVNCPGAAELSMTLPWEVKVGMRYRPNAQIGLNLDFVYQGWQSMGELVLVPTDINIRVAGSEPRPVETFHIPKRWRHSASLRLGASFTFPFGLTAYAGSMYEESASLDEYTNIDFLHFNRLFFTGGAGYKTGGIEVIAGAAYTPAVTREIASSEVRAGSTDPEIAGAVVGVGTYTSGGLVATLGIRGNFGGKEK